MRINMKMPDLATNEGAEIDVLKWLIEVGQPVKRGQAILEIETDKAVQEVESIADGVLETVHVTPGQKVLVGTVIASIQVK